MADKSKTKASPDSLDDPAEENRRVNAILDSVQTQNEMGRGKGMSEAEKAKKKKDRLKKLYPTQNQDSE